MVILLTLNVLLFLPVFVSFVVLIWLGTRTKADPGSDAGGDGGTPKPPSGPFSGPDTPGRLVPAGPNDLPRSA